MPRISRSPSDARSSRAFAVTPGVPTVERIPSASSGQFRPSRPSLASSEAEPVDRALIFTRTSMARTGGKLESRHSANAIHGNKSQNHRERVLAAFRSGESAR